MGERSDVSNRKKHIGSDVVQATPSFHRRRIDVNLIEAREKWLGQCYDLAVLHATKHSDRLVPITRQTCTVVVVEFKQNASMCFSFVLSYRLGHFFNFYFFLSSWTNSPVYNLAASHIQVYNFSFLHSLMLRLNLSLCLAFTLWYCSRKFGYSKHLDSSAIHFLIYISIPAFSPRIYLREQIDR